MEFFGTVRQKFLTENRDTSYLLPTPLVCKFFWYPKLVKHWGFSLRIFSALWDKKFSTEDLDTPSLLSINFLATGNLMKHSAEKFPYGFLRHCQTINFWQKIVIFPPPLILKLFGYRKADETQHRRVPLWNSSALSEKKILTENRDTSYLLPPLLVCKFFRYPNLVKH